MLRVVTMAMLVRAVDADASVQTAAAVFLAAQVALAYTVSGISKAQSRMWWNGDAIRGIFSTQYFGVRALARLVDRHQWLATALGLSVVAWESCFALAMLADARVTSVALFIAATFHLASGFIMGLDGFLLPFLSTFPAVVFVAARMNAILSPLSRVAIAAVMACVLTGWMCHWQATTRHAR